MGIIDHHCAVKVYKYDSKRLWQTESMQVFYQWNAQLSSPSAFTLCNSQKECVGNGNTANWKQFWKRFCHPIGLRVSNSDVFGWEGAHHIKCRKIAERVETISTGSLTLDYALGIGGLPRGCVWKREIIILMSDAVRVITGESLKFMAPKALGRLR